MKKQKHVHLLGIGGSAMSNVALMFHSCGWEVTGTDQNVYPPASTSLEKNGIGYYQGYKKEHVHAGIDLVIVGNVISRDNVEAQKCMELDLPYLSMPQALFDHFMKDKARIAICGTHGKTTTTSLLSWILDCSKNDPSFFIGGVPVNYQRGYHIGKGAHFVIEGDEYDTAYFEKTPKFLHYHPQHVILTSIEFDHADIYRDFDHVYEQFDLLVKQIPQDGSLVACFEHASVKKVSENFPHTVSYAHQDADWTLKNQQDEPYGQSFDVFKYNVYKGRVKTELLGPHSRLNILACLAQAEIQGVDVDKAIAAIETFQGVKKRQELKGEKGNIAVYEDFAHHPTAIATTLSGFVPLKQRRKGKLIVAIEPRSNTMRRKIFQDQLPQSFDQADVIFIANVFAKKDALSQDQMLRPQDIVTSLEKRGKKAFAPHDLDELLRDICQMAKPNDVVVFMSNGDFQGASSKLLDLL
ncbi:MAG: UDP-N-acetylmuramate:L-alanyl-gamma-D-glutamyl-meso-diaminopimelate ligase [Bdellovibrionales bacterium]|nr:UDP-N-acetylmuramate:L-alanyl-gamma-D-glutamyl-meso-diaminopimelate ligase [Bdellovibrionales bacterium]